jgi:hypothetical protein
VNSLHPDQRLCSMLARLRARGCVVDCDPGLEEGIRRATEELSKAPASELPSTSASSSTSSSRAQPSSWIGAVWRKFFSKKKK